MRQSPKAQNMNIPIVSTIAAVVLYGGVACGGDFMIARRGASADCTIVVSEKASPSVRFAAQKLCNYVKRMTGVTLKQATDAEPLSGKAVLIGLLPTVPRAEPRFCADTDLHRHRHMSLQSHTDTDFHKKTTLMLELQPSSDSITLSCFSISSF